MAAVEALRLLVEQSERFHLSEDNKRTALALIEALVPDLTTVNGVERFFEQQCEILSFWNLGFEMSDRDALNIFVSQIFANVEGNENVYVDFLGDTDGRIGEDDFKEVGVGATRSFSYRVINISSGDNVAFLFQCYVLPQPVLSTELTQHGRLVDNY